MKHIKSFEIDNYIVTTNTDLRYAIVIEFEGKLYVNAIKEGDVNGFIDISNIEHISQVINHLPQYVKSEIDKFKDIVGGKIDIMTIDKLKLLIDVNKYNL